jgi:hypothetical protein
MNTKIYPFTPIKLVFAKKSPPPLLIGLVVMLTAFFPRKRLSKRTVLSRHKHV